MQFSLTLRFRRTLHTPPGPSRSAAHWVSFSSALLRCDRWIDARCLRSFGQHSTNVLYTQSSLHKHAPQRTSGIGERWQYAFAAPSHTHPHARVCVRDKYSTRSRYFYVCIRSSLNCHFCPFGYWRMWVCVRARMDQTRMRWWFSSAYGRRRSSGSNIMGGKTQKIVCGIGNSSAEMIFGECDLVSGSSTKTTSSSSVRLVSLFNMFALRWRRSFGGFSCIAHATEWPCVYVCVAAARVLGIPLAPLFCCCFSIWHRPSRSMHDANCVFLKARAFDCVAATANFPPNLSPSLSLLRHFVCRRIVSRFIYLLPLLSQRMRLLFGRLNSDGDAITRDMDEYMNADRSVCNSSCWMCAADCVGVYEPPHTPTEYIDNRIAYISIIVAVLCIRRTHTHTAPKCACVGTFAISIEPAAAKISFGNFVKHTRTVSLFASCANVCVWQCVCVCGSVWVHKIGADRTGCYTLRVYASVRNEYNAINYSIAVYTLVRSFVRLLARSFVRWLVLSFRW